jgi:hypothetical protein
MFLKLWLLEYMICLGSLVCFVSPKSDDWLCKRWTLRGGERGCIVCDSSLYSLAFQSEIRSGRDHTVSYSHKHPPTVGLFGTFRLGYEYPTTPRPQPPFWIPDRLTISHFGLFFSVFLARQCVCCCDALGSGVLWDFSLFFQNIYKYLLCVLVCAWGLCVPINTYFIQKRPYIRPHPLFFQTLRQLRIHTRAHA